MIASRSTLMVALVVVALAVSSEALFGHKKNKNNQVVTQYVPVPTAQQGYYEQPGHQQHGFVNHGGHHLHGGHHQHGGHHGGASTASATAGHGGSASATASGGGSASASAVGGAHDYYYPESPDYYNHPTAAHYAPAPAYHQQHQQPMVQSVGPACIAPCYGGLVQQAHMMPTEKPKRGLFGKKKPATGQTPMIVQQQYINNGPQY